jgi:CHAT domain-containing protein
MKLYFLPLLFWCLAQPSATNAQISASPLWLVAAQQALDTFNYATACNVAQNAFNDPNQPPLLRSKAGFLAGKALYLQEKFALATPFFDSVIVLQRQFSPSGSFEEAEAWMALAQNRQSQRQLDAAITAAQNGLAIFESLSPQWPIQRANALVMLGDLYMHTSQFSAAIPRLEQALSIKTEHFGSQSVEAAGIRIKQGYAYLYAEKFSAAIATLEAALRTLSSIDAPPLESIAKTCQTLGSCHKRLKKFDNALFYYQQAVTTRLEISRAPNVALAWCYSDLGEAFLAKKNTDAAMDAFQKSAAQMRDLGLETDPDFGYVCHNIGRVAHAQGNYPEAIAWQQKALELLRSGVTTDNTDIGGVLLYLGRAQLANGDYQQAIESMQGDQNILTRLLGPDCTLLFHSDGSLATAYRQWFVHTDDPELLIKSKYHLARAQQNIEKRLRDEPSSWVQRKTLYEAVPIYESAIATAKINWDQNGDLQARNNAWHLNEAMHGYQLYAARQEVSSRKFAGIPDEALANDAAIRAAITKLEKQRMVLLLSGKYSLIDTTILALNQQIEVQKAAGIALVQHFETTYPNYYKQKYLWQPVSLETIQKQLTPQQTLLEYFTGDEAIYLFVVQAKGCQILEIRKDFPLAEWVQGLREGITGYYNSSEKTPDLYSKTVLQYANFAQKLYSALLLPAKEWLTPELIIVPGDELHDLPFEVLLSAAPADLSSFKTYPFLVSQYTIQYAFSATLWHQMCQQTPHPAPAKSVLALAPFIETNSTSLATRMALTPLPFSGKEIDCIKKWLPQTTTLLTGQAATRQQFLAQLAQHRVLHLATHGKANALEGAFSYLAFATENEQPQDGLLSVTDLYNQTLQTELVVLSACETGLGELQRGEGILSLSRAFAFAGAHSIVSSFWSVNDEATMLVMDGFYRLLSGGAAKNTALRTAKLQYLQQHPAAAHPFYWAGCVLVGDGSPLHE